MTASEILKIAAAEIGYTESPANSNRTKYGEAYGWNGVAWCVIFLWWCFHEANASDLFYGGGKTASCGQLRTYAVEHKQWITDGDYKVGDLVIFDFPGTSAETDHIGIVESVNGSVLTTIEGNTSPTDSGSQYNGGCVARKKRDTLKTKIVGAYRPEYTEDGNMSYEQWKEYMKKYREELREKPGSEWSKDDRDWAVSNGIVQGDDNDRNMWQDFVSREQMAAMMHRLDEKAN